jgi:hypothetical protein
VNKIPSAVRRSNGFISQTFPFPKSVICETSATGPVRGQKKRTLCTLPISSTS